MGKAFTYTIRKHHHYIGGFVIRIAAKFNRINFGWLSLPYEHFPTFEINSFNTWIKSQTKLEWNRVDFASSEHWMTAASNLSHNEYLPNFGWLAFERYSSPKRSFLLQFNQLQWSCEEGAVVRARGWRYRSPGFDPRWKFNFFSLFIFN